MATTVITHVIKDPSGTAMPGIEVVAKLNRPAVRTADDSQVSRVETAISDATGTATLTLERTADMTPATTYYVVEVRMPASQGGPEVYTIQVGSGAASLHDSKVNV